MSESSHARSKAPLLKDSSYKTVKHAAALGLPALGAFYFTLAQIWHLPHAEEVMGTIAALNTLLGILLGLATKSYNNSEAKFVGDVTFEPIDGDQSTKRMVARLNTHPQVISSMDEVLFKVVEE